MTGLRSTGALWLDIVLLGVAFLALLLLLPLVMIVNPRQAVDPGFDFAAAGFTITGAVLIAFGALLGRRTRWEVPDSAKRRPR